jgi:hypothetical protein
MWEGPCGAALALLEQIPLDKRKIGALGVFLSLVNCYNLAPALALTKKKAE